MKVLFDPKLALMTCSLILCMGAVLQMQYKFSKKYRKNSLSPSLPPSLSLSLSRECRIACPWELLYADDVVIMSDNFEDLKIQLQTCRTSLETRGLRINVGETKILGPSGEDQKPTRNVKWPCSVCSKGVGVNLILCQTCNLWIHKRCS